MSAKAVECMNAGSHRDSLAEDRDDFLALHEAPPQRTMGLKADNHNVCRGLVEIELQMMENPSRITHSGSRENNARPLHIVDLLGIVGGHAWFEDRAIQRQQ